MEKQVFLFKSLQFVSQIFKMFLNQVQYKVKYLAHLISQSPQSFILEVLDCNASKIRKGKPGKENYPHLSRNSRETFIHSCCSPG